MINWTGYIVLCVSEQKLGVAIHHFILTRFNLPLWNKDKTGKGINREKWLEDRIFLFEKYSLPSVMAQTCNDFVWVLLADAETPDVYKEKFRHYNELYPQIRFAFLKRQYAYKFAEAFRQIVCRLLQEQGTKSEDLCLTTYLDNDDVIAADYIEDIQSRVEMCQYGTFISYDYGYQYFTELSLTSRIKYANNHFMTLVEDVDHIKTCYGYGSHFLLEKNKVAKVVHVNDKSKPMWMEVIHKCNVDNDVKMTFDTKVLTENETKEASRRFSIALDYKKNNLYSYYMRCLKQVYRRSLDKIIPPR